MQTSSQIGIVATVLFLGIYAFTRRRHSLPGPRGYPVVGNLFDMPKTKEWLYWAHLKDIYGPISAVSVLGQTIVLLNTIDVCNDLLDKRSSIYSGRPILHFAGDMVGWDRQMIFTQDGERHKTMRRMVARFIGTKAAVSAYKDVQETEARWFLLAMADRPIEVLTNIRTATSAMFLKMAHGYTIEREKKDPLINVIETAAQEFYVAAAPGSWLVDFIPWLKYLPDWLPGTGFKAVAARFRETNMRQVNVPITFIKEQMAKDSATPCFSTRVLESKLTPQEVEAFPFVATALYGGGQDTVSATVGTFFLAMVLYPEVQRKIQEEIDSVVGRYRLPAMEDLENMPYLQASLKEVMRWHTVACINGPHYTLDSDWYQGCYIPKGAIVLANLWQIANDPDNYANPSIFRPERFLGEKPEMDPNSFVWGFGRRRCPGIELAKACCLHTMATTLAVLDIIKAKDENGVELTPKGEFISSTVCHPEPFPCATRIRSADAEVLLQAIRRDYVAQPSDSHKLKL